MSLTENLDILDSLANQIAELQSYTVEEMEDLGPSFLPDVNPESGMLFEPAAMAFDLDARATEDEEEMDERKRTTWRVIRDTVKRLICEDEAIQAVMENDTLTLASKAKAILAIVLTKLGVNLKNWWVALIAIIIAIAIKLGYRAFCTA